MSAIRVVRCSVGSESYAFRITDVRSIHRREEMLAGAKLGVGVVGTLPGSTGTLPVYALARQFGLPEPSARSGGQILTFGDGGSAWGLAVDQVSRVLEIPSGEVLPLPRLAGELSGMLFEGVLKVEEALVLLVASTALDLVPALDPGAAYPGPAEEEVQAVSRPARAETRAARTSAGRILVFSTRKGDGGEAKTSYALSLRQVAEVTEARPSTRVPFAPPHVLGLIPWRERTIPVVDVAMRLGLDRSDAGAARLLVARSTREEGAEVAFPIPADAKQQSVPVLPPASETDPRLDLGAVLGVFSLDSLGSLGLGDLIVPDLERIVSTG